MTHSQLLKSALAGAVVLGFTSIATLASAQPMKMTPEMMKEAQAKTMQTMKKMHYLKCYGINAAFKNDCKAASHSCAGQDAKARDPGTFVLTPAGLCGKIDGGSLQAS